MDVVTRDIATKKITGLGAAIRVIWWGVLFVMVSIPLRPLEWVTELLQVSRAGTAYRLDAWLSRIEQHLTGGAP